MVKKFRFHALVLTSVLISCGGQPVSTEYKNKIISLPGSGSGDLKSSGVGGDIAKGQAALTSKCSSCHSEAGGSPILDASYADKIDAEASKSYHSSVKSVFAADGANIKAALKGSSGTGAQLKGDAKTGGEILTTSCDTCHGKTASALTKANKITDATFKAGTHAGVEVFFKDPQKVADMNAGLGAR